MSRERFADMITIGRIIRPQGRKGEVLVEPLSDQPDRFPSLSRAFLPGPDGAARPVQVRDAWPHKGRFVLKLEGVDSIDEADDLRGLDLRIPEGDVSTLPPGSYYHHQLRGLRVEDPAGRELGRVADVMETGGEAAVLVVRGPNGETLVPLAYAFVREVDLAGGRAVVLVPELVDAD
ncbi:MAG: 16S rRNA processing protein RimM [Acidobacteria bacterium]|nr:MAG: 16S rRNA processing protein RimM [Acidobacteriota bacterium]PYQ18590.1 MAG: 16S rRNA processing protein RimM [Acidobacteriota bacterium]